MFADREFKLKILIYRIPQFLQCFRSPTDCKIKSGKKDLEDENVYVCKEHGEIDTRNATVDLTKDS